MQFTPMTSLPYSSPGCSEKPWARWWDVMSKPYVRLNSWVKFKLEWLPAPTSDAEGGVEEQGKQGIETHAAPQPCNGQSRDWGGPCCSRARQEEGDSVSQRGTQQQVRKEKTENRRVFVLRSGAKGWGKTRPHSSDPFCFRTAETPWASTSHTFSGANGQETQICMETRPWVEPILHAGSWTTPNPNTAALI